MNPEGRRCLRAGIEVNGRTALITGSSRGIGQGIALKLAQCGVGQIAVHYLNNKEAAEETVRRLREMVLSELAPDGPFG